MEVLERCLNTNADSLSDEDFQYKVQLQYSFLDDCKATSDTASSDNDASPVNTECTNQWRPMFSAKDHPLAQMVRGLIWMHHTCNSTEICGNLVNIFNPIYANFNIMH